MNGGKHKDVLNYFIVILVILFNTSPFFLYASKPFWIILISTLVVIALLARKHLEHKKIIFGLAILWVLIILQGISFGEFTPATVYQPILVLYTPYLVFSIVGLSFYRYLFNVIYVTVIYTSIIYLFQVLSPNFNAFLLKLFDFAFLHSWSDWPRSIIFYSIPRESTFFLPRNSGIFHEPGAYSIYIVLALILNTIYTKKAFGRKNIILILVLLTTFSTAGYVMLFIFLVYALWGTKLNIFIKIFLLSLFVIFAIGIYQDTEFLQNKIESQYATQDYLVEKDVKNQRGRFYSFRMTGKALLSSPIYGRGIISNTEYDVGGTGSYGYGFIGMFAKFGIIFGVLYLWLFYKGFRFYSDLYNTPINFTRIAFIILNLGLLSQSFFFHISFVLFFIVGLIYPAKARIILKDNQRLNATSR